MRKNGGRYGNGAAHKSQKLKGVGKSNQHQQFKDLTELRRKFIEKTTTPESSTNNSEGN